MGGQIIKKKGPDLKYNTNKVANVTLFLQIPTLTIYMLGLTYSFDFRSLYI